MRIESPLLNRPGQFGTVLNWADEPARRHSDAGELQLKLQLGSAGSKKGQRAGGE
jgi:hypothetical protein